MADLLTQEQIKMYKEAFNVFDKNGTGRISTKELGVIMRSLKQNPTEEELAELIAEVDQDGNGEIDFNEFLFMMAKRTKDSDMLDRALEAFRVFDRQNKGTIPLNELRYILENLGEKLTPEEVEDLLSDVEEIHGGTELDYKTFLNNLFSNL
jgi:Ca2+-binding protein (EF-Hand superfamily)